MNVIALYSIASTAIAVVVLGLLRWAVSLRARRNSKPIGRVVGVVGKMGTGKSYLAVRTARDRLRQGVDVWSNFSMDVPEQWGGKWGPFRSWDQFASIRDAVVIIDEAHLMAPSYAHQRFPATARQALAFARKNGLDVYWISQHEDRVNRTLRDLTNEIGVCTKSRRRFKVTWYPSEDVRKKGEHSLKESYPFDQAVADLYDTSEIISMDDHLAAR